jgi:hypothetical protein
VGRTGTFRIHRLDVKAGVADLKVEGTDRVEKDIRLSTIQPIKEDVNEAAARTVREATKD